MGAMMSSNGAPVEPAPPTYTNAEILDEFMEVPDDQWPETLEDHPALAAVVRAEIHRLRNEHYELTRMRDGLIEVLRKACEELDRA